MKLLVAGVGNIFFGDDGFGPEVARLLAAAPIEGTKVEDYGIRTLHLAYELLEGYDRAFLIDAVPRGGVPGTIYVLEPETDAPSTVPDAHSLDLRTVFALVRTLGGEPPPITIVGCEPSATYPESAAQESMGLTDAVRGAVRPAADIVRQLVERTKAGDATHERRSSVWTEA